MLPSYYTCNSCHDEFRFTVRDGYYYIGGKQIKTQVASKDLLEIPVRPVWCKECAVVSVVEDILPLRAFENALGIVRRGQPVEYPIGTEPLEQSDAEELVGAYLRWRMTRRHAARTLCCGKANYQFMDVAQPLLKHAECDFGFIEPVHVFFPHCGPGPGVNSPANIRLFNTEGELIGLLTWLKQGEWIWSVEPLSYPPDLED